MGSRREHGSPPGSEPAFHDEATVALLANHLQWLVQEELAEQTSEGTTIVAELRKKILQAFKQGKRFSRLYHEAWKLLSVPLSEEELSDYLARLAGGLYQDLAYAILAGRLKEVFRAVGGQETGAGLTLLSPEKTLAFYQYLYPPWVGAESVSHPLNLASIQGVWVPDGLVVDVPRRRIAGFCEYTLQGGEAKFENVFHHFQLGCRNPMLRPLLWQERLVFVLPQETNLPGWFEAERDGGVILTLFPPFSHGQFRHFVEDVYREYRQYDGRLLPDSDADYPFSALEYDVSATLAEWQERIRFQAERRRGGL